MKKGFTLVELLAVVAIISALAIITVPLITGTIEDANRKAFLSGAQNVLDVARAYVTRVEETGSIPEEGIKVSELSSELKNQNYISGIINKQEDGSIVVDALSDGVYCVSGTKNDLNIVKGKCEELDSTPPTVKVLLNKKTSTSITILVNAKDEVSGIYGYSYSIDGINYSEIKNENIYTVNDLKSDETVKIYVRVYNNLYDKTNSEENLKKSMTESIVEYTTTLIEKPIFKISTSESSASTVKIVEIYYPKNVGNYEYSYLINGEETKINEEFVRLTITSNNSEIVGRIKNNNEVIENKIRIAGLDNEGPVGNIVYNPSWETTKKVKIEVISEQTGLPEEPYSYDGGRTWTSSDEKIYINSENITGLIQVRDILGNITNKLTVNGEEVENIIIGGIDNQKPECELEVKSGTLGQNNWYTSSVTVGFKEVRDTLKYCEGDSCSNVEGSGIKSTTIDIPTVTENKVNVVTGTVEDNAGNTNTCTITVNKDEFTPSINAKAGTAQLTYAQNYALTNLFNMSNYSSSSGTTTCYLIVNNTRNRQVSNNNELELGINIVECEMVTGAGKKSSARVTIAHSYGATPYCAAGTYKNGTCYITEWSNCATTINTCQYGCDSRYDSCMYKKEICVPYGYPACWDPNRNCDSKGKNCLGDYTCFFWDDCYTTITECSEGTDYYNCSNCKTGSPNTCQGGNVTVNHPEYIRYYCTSNGKNTNTNQVIGVSLSGTTCKF